ncbi:MAG: hypothetical protein ABW088_18000 [Sedimenticola sp.]
MGRFVPCQGKSACRDDELRCLTCGRGLHEVDRLRQLMDQLATLAIEYDYENAEEYSNYVATKLQKSINHRRKELLEA